MINYAFPPHLLQIPALENAGDNIALLAWVASIAVLGLAAVFGILLRNLSEHKKEVAEATIKHAGEVAELNKELRDTIQSVLEKSYELAAATRNSMETVSKAHPEMKAQLKEMTAGIIKEIEKLSDKIEGLRK